MKVSRRIVIPFLLFSLLISAGISLLVQSIYHSSGFHLPQIIGIFVVLTVIAAVGKMLHYQEALNRAKQNLDEAQQLADIGSWERDLASGKGYWSDNHYTLFNIPRRRKAPCMEEFFSMIRAEEREQVRETVTTAIRSNGSYEIKYMLEEDPEKRIFLSRGKVLLDDSGSPATLVGTVQDITEKQRCENSQQELLKQKELFITRLGHDLKTPLTPLVAFLPMIREQAKEPMQAKQLDLCVKSVNHINDLVAKTLKLARLTSSAELLIERTDFSLSSVLDSSVSVMSDAINEVHLRIENRIPSDMTVHGIREELEELFTQLISNAVIFSRQDPTLVIDADSDATFTTVRFSDNGVGLMPEELNSIFDDFYKADHSRHKLNSSGLGLTICRRIVENHGGSISARSPGKGGGTTVYITLKNGELS
ncbi:MAG: ATP-binding protein [Desulfuromonadaceae bacterium]|nr:ATP-binding protein [Desulfuromonadaceae bacterium]MDD2855027.1 ATP-binding protein [Desulfuromonadaceae bacterium]